ncbi:MAG TPA: VIT domain-containing protein, partial [bacterium]|nr:VIT domain-containing protein [bacterium]
MKKTILTVLFSLFFSLNGQSINFTPRLSTEEGDIKISSVSVDVKVISNIAVTTIEMNFYNPLPRVLEGEFSFPLAQGQSLSRFALEINGVLREGVTVDKNEGQKIFESIVRRGVDPGLLEMTQGNSFRSRVYPIPSQGYKKIVIAYEETLVRNEKGFRYLFPFTFDYPITLFIFNADVLNQEIIPYIEENDFAKFTFTKNQKNYNTGFKKNNFILSRPVSFTIPSSEKADSIFTEEKADTTYFYSNISVKPLTKSKKIPEKLCIAWDSSGSGGKRNVSAEIQIIEKYIKKMGKGTVTLIPFAEDIYEHTEFVFENGKSTDLISKLKATVFDGGTQLGALNLNSFTCDEILLFSDGISNFGKEEIGLSKVPVFIINSSIEAEHAYLRSIALKTGGEYINLAATGIDAAFASLENYSYRFISASYDHSKVKELFPKLPEKIEGGFSFAGILLEPTAEITLNFGFGNEIIESRKIIVEKHPNLTTTGYLRRIWAEKKISELYINLEKNRPEITQLGKDFGIVTNFTSLIVLETVQDYVRYGVEPPEEMKKEYNDQKNAMLKTSKESNLADLEDIFFKFKMIIEWWTGKKSKEEQKIENITETSNENRQPLREGISDAPILRKSLGDEGRTGARRSRVANAQSSARRGLDSSGAAKFDRVFGGGGLDAGMERSLGSVT